MTQQKKQFVVAIAVIQDEEGKVLMQKRVDPEPAWAYGKWEFPGGGIEWGESPEEALHREVAEEIACKVGIIGLIPSIASVVRPGDNGSEFHALLMYYRCRILSGEKPLPMDPEVGEIRWWPLHEACKFDLLPGDEKILEYLKDSEADLQR